MKLDPSFGCIRPAELPELIRAIEGYQGAVVQLALKLTMLTLARTRDIRAAKWEEFHDLAGDAPVWRLPATRLRVGQGGEIPLSRQAVAVLEELRHFTGGGVYLFPDEERRDKPLSEVRLLHALWSLGYRGRMTVHGFRSLGSTILSEAGYPSILIQRALALDPIEATHDRMGNLKEQREMLQCYADMLRQMEA